MTPMSTVLQISIRLKGKRNAGAEDRQRKISGFDQEVYSKSKILCVGAGGLISQIAPVLCRKGIGGITLFDHDIVEESNLNRQRFYARDIGQNKAIALAANLQAECIFTTEICGYALALEEAFERSLDLSCAAAICGVDNNSARVLASRYFRSKQIPVIFTAVSVDADHGYVFVQDAAGPCFRCLFPDASDRDPLPCPGTPAIADILQVVGGMVVYAVDSLLMNRSRTWNYRRFALASGDFDGAQVVDLRADCPERHG
jgi:molybdopterin/thiamine biosynthesis adenylyltransferase